MNEVTFMTSQTVETEIIEMISDHTKIDRIGLLSPASDCTITFAGGKQTKKYLDDSAIHNMNVRIFGKGTDQLAVAERLCGICNSLTYGNFRKFRKTNQWEIRRITVVTAPALKEQEQDGTWFYDCVISITYFYKPRKD